MAEPNDDPELEFFLRQFDPRAPSPLPVKGRRLRRIWWTLAGASLAAGALWLGFVDRTPPAAGRRQSEPEQSLPSHSKPTLVELSVVLRPAEAARVGEELEGHILADPRRRGGALQAMASAGPER